MGKPYRVCPVCGCNLDPGEICDCQKREREETQPAAVEVQPQEAQRKAG